MKKPFLSSGKNILGMATEFPPQISRELDSVWGTSKSEHTGFPGDAVLVILPCVPCKAGQVCRGKVGSGRGPGKMAYGEEWEVAWEEHGMDMQQIWIPGTLGKSGSQSPMSQVNWFRRS